MFPQSRRTSLPRLNDSTAHGAKVCVVAYESDANIYGVRRQAKRDAALDGVPALKFPGKARKSGVALRLPPHSIVIYPSTIESLPEPVSPKSSSCFFTRLKHSGHMPCVNDAWERSIMYISISRQRPVSSLILLQ